LKIEDIVDGAMHAEEALSRSSRLKGTNFRLKSSLRGRPHRASAKPWSRRS
jgi:hypothetical protein